MSKEQIIIGKDRSYYRMQKDEELIEEAKYNPNPELAIALAERMEKNRLEALDNFTCPNCGY